MKLVLAPKSEQAACINMTLLWICEGTDRTCARIVRCLLADSPWARAGGCRKFQRGNLAYWHPTPLSDKTSSVPPVLIYRSIEVSETPTASEVKKNSLAMVLFASACLLSARFQRRAIDQREVQMAQVMSAQVTLSANSSHEICKHKNHISQWGPGGKSRP